jgi:TRAP-type C4-dicarboxylate transport system permease small subunit
VAAGTGRDPRPPARLRHHVHLTMSPADQPDRKAAANMSSIIRAVAGWVQRRSENVIAALLGIMFVAFLCQIVFRYFLNLPTGWSTETVVVCWLWLVLLGTALALKEKDEIRFDILTSVAGPGARRVMAAIASIGAVILFSLSLPATYDYVAFMKVERSSYLKIRLDWLYSVYLVFVVAIILRYLWLLWEAVRGEPLDGETSEEGPTR